MGKERRKEERKKEEIEEGERKESEVFRQLVHEKPLTKNEKV